jgi:two-component system, chemotaxis family, chemotaxis protein CheY
MAQILFVEDNEYLQKIVPYTLKLENIQCTAVGTALEALNLAQMQQFDVVVTDINMPGMNGLELISKLREHANYQNTPILCLTTEIDPATLAEAKQRGAQEVVLKPYTPQELVAAIQTHLNPAD